MGAAFDLQAISAAFSAAAIDPSRWDAAMDVADRVTGSSGALLFDLNSHLPGVPRSSKTAPAHDAYVRDGWIDRDERFRLAPFLEKRSIATDFDIFTPDDIVRHPYYQEFLAPFGLRWCALVKVAAGDDSWVLSLQRTIAQGPFSSGELEELAKLSGQLGPAAAVARALGFACAEAASEALDSTGMAAVMIDRNGRAVRVNQSAERLLGRDLQVSGGRLVSADRNATDAFQRSLHALLSSREPAASMPPIVLPRVDRLPLLAYQMRLVAVSLNAFSHCQAIVVIVDPEVSSRPPEAVLRSCFGLTGAEAKLARQISSGKGLETVADELAISYETARNHVKAVFAKTGTHRQSELAALLTRIALGPKVEHQE
jgi:DNA-binding CsgD family transcriptional regulator/PAS domain-containing protein